MTIVHSLTVAFTNQRERVQINLPNPQVATTENSRGVTNQLEAASGRSIFDEMPEPDVEDVITSGTAAEDGEDDETSAALAVSAMLELARA